MFSRFFDYLNKKGNHNDDDEDDDDDNKDDDDKKKDSSSEQNLSDSSETAKHRKKEEKSNYLTKYAYLDNAKHIDLNGLISMSDDLRSNVEILRNSYLSIIKSLVILNERRRQRIRRRNRQYSLENEKSLYQQCSMKREYSGRKFNSSDSLEMLKKKNYTTDSKTNSIAAAADDNTNDSWIYDKNFLRDKQISKTSNDNNNDDNEWDLVKFCNPETREEEFQNLFDQAEQFRKTIDRYRLGREELIDMNRFRNLVKQGKKLLEITEILKNNYSNNFLNIFRLR